MSRANKDEGPGRVEGRVEALFSPQIPRIGKKKRKPGRLAKNQPSGLDGEHEVHAVRARTTGD